MSWNERCMDMAIDFIRRNKGAMIDGFFYADEEGPSFDSDGSYTVDSGASKIVLIDRDSSNENVVKIPFRGMVARGDECIYTRTCADYNAFVKEQEWTFKVDYWREEEGLPPLPYTECPCWNCDNEEYSSNVQEFENAADVCEDYENVWDYCEAESYLGQAAEDCGVDNLFVPTLFMSEVEGIPCYTQKRVEMGDHGDPTKESRKKFDEINCTQWSSISTTCGALILENYGEETLNKVIKFVNEYNIADLHGGNWAFSNNNVVFVDYSGYRDC